MMSLVADYGSSDNDSDLDKAGEAPKVQVKESTSDEADSSDSSTEEMKVSSQTITKLPSARDLLESSSGVPGVLTNRFKIAEDQKIANLERHVKMVNTDLNTKTKNGKKICWSYRKGRCRFGSACTFAHDSDVQGLDSKKEEVRDLQTSNSSEMKGRTKSASGITDKVRKKRPGLSNSLVPGKRVVKMYKNLKKS